VKQRKLNNNNKKKQIDTSKTRKRGFRGNVECKKKGNR